MPIESESERPTTLNRTLNIARINVITAEQTNATSAFDKPSKETELFKFKPLSIEKTESKTSSSNTNIEGSRAHEQSSQIINKTEIADSNELLINLAKNSIKTAITNFYFSSSDISSFDTVTYKPRSTNQITKTEAHDGTSPHGRTVD